MSEFISAHLTVGQINALVKKLGGEQAVKAFLRDELQVIGDLPQSSEVSGNLSTTIFYDACHDERLSFRSSDKALFRRVVSFTVREWGTGRVIVSDSVTLEADGELVGASVKLPHAHGPYTIECSLA